LKGSFACCRHPLCQQPFRFEYIAHLWHLIPLHRKCLSFHS
jgi:hypothetical protein